MAQSRSDDGDGGGSFAYMERELLAGSVSSGGGLGRLRQEDQSQLGLVQINSFFPSQRIYLYLSLLASGLCSRRWRSWRLRRRCCRLSRRQRKSWRCRLCRCRLRARRCRLRGYRWRWSCLSYRLSSCLLSRRRHCNVGVHVTGVRDIFSLWDKVIPTMVFRSFWSHGLLSCPAESRQGSADSRQWECFRRGLRGPRRAWCGGILIPRRGCRRGMDWRKGARGNLV